MAADGADGRGRCGRPRTVRCGDTVRARNVDFRLGGRVATKQLETTVFITKAQDMLKGTTCSHSS